jgi:hypothetical protein
MRYTQCLATAAQGMRGANEQASQERRREKKRAGNPDPALDAVFGAYPKPVKTKLLALRRLIFDTAKTVKGVGALEEALKWGQPSYLTSESKSGSTIRIDQVRAEAGQYAIYFHCQTDLVDPFASSIRSCAMAATAASCSTPRTSCPRPRCATAWHWR